VNSGRLSRRPLPPAVGERGAGYWPLRCASVSAMPGGTTLPWSMSWDSSASQRYVEYMGGAAAMLARARKDMEKGEYRWVAEAVNHVVFADLANQQARELLADCFEQLGYQAEAGTWRNIYLTGAQELRGGIKKAAAPTAVSPELPAALPIGGAAARRGQVPSIPPCSARRCMRPTG